MMGRKWRLTLPLARIEVATFLKITTSSPVPRRTSWQDRNAAKKGSVLKNATAREKFAEASDVELLQRRQNLQERFGF